MVYFFLGGEGEGGTVCRFPKATQPCATEQTKTQYNLHFKKKLFTSPDKTDLRSLPRNPIQS